MFNRMKRSMVYADKKFCKARRGKVPFSERMKKLSGAILVLRIMKRRVLWKRKKNREKRAALKASGEETGEKPKPKPKAKPAVSSSADTTATGKVQSKIIQEL